MFNNYKKINKEKGFTLIEIMVAGTIFAVVMTIVAGSVLSIVSANRKSKNMRSVMDNLNLTLESITRTVRFGTKYHCDNIAPINVPKDCINGDTILTFQSVDGAQLSYYLSGGRIRLLKGGVEYFVTSPDTIIDSLKFFVIGSAAYPDLNQPKVIITLSGHVGNDEERSTFNLQTTITQRQFDFSL